MIRQSLPIKTPLEGNGDFRNQECLDLLDEADIVVTNPPFSLFREYVAVLMEHEKKFLIIGNKGAITYKEMFTLIKQNKIWIGYTPMSTDLLFRVPESYIDTLKAKSAKGSAYRIIDNVIYARAAAIWYTNLDHNKRHEKLILWKTYTEQEYPTYDNYDAINVNKTDEIPIDYDGTMGVPITFLDKFNPDQFEILNCSAYSAPENYGCGSLFINGKKVYARALIRKKVGV